MILEKHSVIQNVLYCLRCTAECYFSLLLWCGAVIALKVALAVMATYLPKVVIEKFTAGSSFSKLAAAVLLFMGSIALMSGGENFFGKYISFQRLRMNTFYMKRVAVKGLTTDYCNQENEKFRKLQSEAFECCGNNGSPLTSIYDMLMNFLVSLLGLTVYSGLLIGLHPGIILLLVVTTAAGYFLNKTIIRWMAENDRERIGYRQRMDYINNVSGDIRSAKDIRLYHMSEWFSDLFGEAMKGTARWYRRFTSRVFGVSVCDSGLTLVRESAACIYLLFLVLEGQIGAADFVLYFGVTAGFSSWLDGIMTQAAALDQWSRRIDYFRSYLAYPEKYCRESETVIAADKIPGTIELKNVSYRYEGASEYALRDISLTIKPAGHLAIVGINGAGKTTLVKLICGLIEPTQGQVLYDGIDIRRYNRTDYYKLFAAVFQQYSLLPVTIEEIVAETPAERADRTKVRKCLEEAGLWEKILQLPQGAGSEFGKMIHDDGVEFSGGEIQKLLLARALYKNAPVLLLDEPTAALDPIAESRLYDNYSRISSGKTALFISHRLASTSFCDRILLLENGVICEEGTHESLLNLQGKYYNLFETQAKYYRDDAGEVTV
ncbi:MAG: ABC transporter ATP-binding protein [Lachnospiraceae bacterium]|nr:ABC transporter ATP-binding protein [Lachnospiraceae bacterium]